MTVCLATENAAIENAAPSKMQRWKMQDGKCVFHPCMIMMMMMHFGATFDSPAFSFLAFSTFPTKFWKPKIDCSSRFCTLDYR